MSVRLGFSLALGFVFLLMMFGPSSGALAQPDISQCNWHSFRPGGATGQPGGYLPYDPGKEIIRTGYYMIYVGPAGKSGTSVPPSTWQAYGPYRLESGFRYALDIIPDGVSLYKEAPILLQFSKPGNWAVVYVLNRRHDQFYAVCILRKEP